MKVNGVEADDPHGADVLSAIRLSKYSVFPDCIGLAALVDISAESKLESPKNRYFYKTWLG